MEPRIRERRATVTRERGRRRLRVVIGFIGVLLLIAAGWLVIRSPLLDVDRVVVTGAQQVSARDVRAAAGLEPGEALVLVDLGAAARRIERLPWVDKARVERNLPDEVAIHVTERTPALWVRRSPEEIALLDERGRVLGNAAPAPADLPELTGVAVVPPPGGSVTPAVAGRVLAALPVELRTEVVRITVAGSDVTLGVRAGPEVRLGPPTAVREKAESALAVLRTLSPPLPAYLDVTSPRAPVSGGVLPTPASFVDQDRSFGYGIDPYHRFT
jgi:cell division protein FtsQ